MKQKILSVVLLVVVVAFVTVNTIVITRQIRNMERAVSAIDISDENATDEAAEIFKEFRQKEVYISLTVNHEDLTNIEDCFVELVGQLSVGNEDEAKVTKDRLTYSLEHLRRLSTFTIDAII